MRAGKAVAGRRSTYDQGDPSGVGAVNGFVRGAPAASRWTLPPAADTLRRVRTLSPVETALVIAVAGSVLAVMVPAFARNLHASRLAEPIDGLNRIATRANAIAAARPAAMAYPASVGLTPEQVPRGQEHLDPPGTWDHPTWRTLGFEWTVPHHYSFEFLSENRPGQALFEAKAHGDLDGDGVFSSFEIAGESKDGSEPMLYPLESYREVE
jgi:hypothetical protein